MMKKLKSKLLFIGAIGTSIIVGQAIYSFLIKESYTIALNESPSLPSYFYVVKNTETENDFKKGSIITFPFPKKDDRYFKYEYNFIKQIRCKEGEYLKYINRNYYCNDEYLGIARTHDSKGKEVEPFVFNGKIPEGKLFVMGTSHNSYDSRYWGFVNKEKVLGVAIW